MVFWKPKHDHTIEQHRGNKENYPIFSMGVSSFLAELDRKYQPDSANRELPENSKQN